MKRGLPVAAAFLAVILAGPTFGRASDHADGPQTVLDNAADLSDLYTFTSPADPNKLVLVMNVHAFSNSTTQFSDAVQYKFRIRPISDAKTMKPGGAEQTITCTFQGGGLFDATQTTTCDFDLEGGSDTVSFQTRGDQYQAGGSGSKGDLKVFAGVRSDTWFVDLSKILKFNNGNSVAKGPGSNGLEGTNVLSIVVELDKRRVGGPLLAVTSQTVRPR